MQQKEHSALTPSQQIGLSICFGPQYLVLTAATLLTKLMQHNSAESAKLPTWFMLGLVLTGFVCGVFLVVVAWTGLGKYTPDYWADIELSFMLLWSMLLEILVFSRLLGDVFGGALIKILLLVLSGHGILLLIVDMIFFAVDLVIGTFIPYMLMLAIAVFRGSMALSYCIIRILAVIRGGELVELGQSGELGELGALGEKIWVPLNIRIIFEVAGFALSFLSLSNGLSRIDYKLVQNGLFGIIGILSIVTRARRHLKVKEQKPIELNRVPTGEGRRAMSLSNRPVVDTIPTGSEVELVTGKDNA